MTCCKKCGECLSSDEIAIYRRLVSRLASSYLCKHCLAKTFDCTVAIIDEKIRYYREQGCFLFP